MKIDATFVRSAAGAGDLPRDGLAEVAMVGRSNVGKSSLINALVRQKVARTSAAPGKTRLANIYRVEGRARRPLYLVDLPGYGYARGASSASEFAALTRAYFGETGQAGQAGRVEQAAASRPCPSALLVVDARHPGLTNDIEAWHWLKATATASAVVATKIDKLARGERIRAMRELESVLEHSVLPVSAVTGEGLDELWILIDRLASNRNSSSRPERPLTPNPTAQTRARSGLRTKAPTRAPKEPRRRPPKR